MKKLIFTLVLTGIFKIIYGQDLNGVTFGFGAGYSHTFDQTYDYSLTTDGTNSLKLQPLNKGGFVISSVLMVKLFKLTYNEDPSVKALVKTGTDDASFWDHFSVNLALNLVDIKPDVSFNENVNGGIGIGYFFNDNLQLALFYDVSQIRQLRDYVVNTYDNKSIPSGANTTYNALDVTDNNLFYNKTISGLSLKLVFSIGNKKSTTTPSPATSSKKSATN